MKKKIIAAALALSVAAIFAPSAQATLTIVGVFAPVEVTLDKKTATIPAPTTNSPGTWSFVLDDPTIATVSGNLLTLLKAGQTRITATISASGGYTEISRSTTLTVKAGTPVIGTFADQIVNYLNRSATLTPPTSSGTGAWSYSSSDPTIASISGRNVTLLDGGSVQITATQTSDGNWLAATAHMTLTINAPKPVVGTFSDITINRDSVGSITLNVPTSTSTGAWILSSSNPAIAAISGRTLTLNSAGKVVITAHQLATAAFGSVTETMTATILSTSPAIGTLPDIQFTWGPNSPRKSTIFAPTSSSPGKWSYISSDPTVANLVDTTIAYFKPGITTITATQAASGNYSAGGPITFKVTINQAPQIGSVASIQKVYGDAQFSLIAPTSDSKGAWSYTSSDPGVISISGGMAKIAGAGSATITATQAPIDYWLGGSTTYSVNVQGSTPTIGAFAPFTVSIGTVTPIKAPTSNSAGIWRFTSSDPAIASIDGGAIFPHAQGQVIITAVQSPSGAYGLSNTVSTIATVSAVVTPPVKPTPSPSASPTPTPTKAPTSKAFAIKVTSSFKLIKISVANPPKGKVVKALIDGREAIVGANGVPSGKHSVVVTVGGKVLYKKVLTIK